MDAGTTSLLVLLLLVAFLASGTIIFISIIAVCSIALTTFMGFDLDRLGSTVARIMIRGSSSWELSAIPLFIWMGEIVFRTSIISQMFQGLTPLVSRLPGGLLHTNVLGCALFSAVSGSSAATTATIGKITLSELRGRNYDNNLALGSLAGAGTLGLLIPPSLVMIIYGLLAEVSIVRLFAAGLIPGLMIAGLYSAYIMVVCSIRPSKAPVEQSDFGVGEALWKLAPITAIIAVVLGTIYSGWATPSESAAVGVLMALFVAALKRELSWELVWSSLKGAVPTACMICTILTAAALLSTTLGFLHVPRDVALFISGLNLSPAGLLLVLAGFYILLGLLLDGISITVMTLPITLPLVLAAGIDPIWFGVFLVVMVELGQMTPPVGFNLFILQGMSGASILRVTRASIPFFLLMCCAAAILGFWPQIALWLPNVLY
ncbi:TRAP transporter large permease [Roseovarius sp. MMSF_3281]|uniref:TRAP transporter large permease n=1 Tax=Roseovarius sp. MMSF_3281 TaxID=3046694 RepID=UPI00273E7B06|nr:TRAP transporter large permease subunit [Roseovarius sp. MMSF_3281]